MADYWAQQADDMQSTDLPTMHTSGDYWAQQPQQSLKELESQSATYPRLLSATDDLTSAPIAGASPAEIERAAMAPHPIMDEGGQYHQGGGLTDMQKPTDASAYIPLLVKNGMLPAEAKQWADETNRFAPMNATSSPGLNGIAEGIRFSAINALQNLSSQKQQTQWEIDHPYLAGIAEDTDSATHPVLHQVADVAQAGYHGLVDVGAQALQTIGKGVDLGDRAIASATGIASNPNYYESNAAALRAKIAGDYRPDTALGEVVQFGGQMLPVYAAPETTPWVMGAGAGNDAYNQAIAEGKDQATAVNQAALQFLMMTGAGKAVGAGTQAAAKAMGLPEGILGQAAAGAGEGYAFSVANRAATHLIDQFGASRVAAMMARQGATPDQIKAAIAPYQDGMSSADIVAPDDIGMIGGMALTGGGRAAINRVFERAPILSTPQVDVSQIAAARNVDEAIAAATAAVPNISPEAVSKNGGADVAAMLRAIRPLQGVPNVAEVDAGSSSEPSGNGIGSVGDIRAAGEFDGGGAGTADTPAGGSGADQPMGGADSANASLAGLSAADVQEVAHAAVGPALSPHVEVVQSLEDARSAMGENGERALSSVDGLTEGFFDPKSRRLILIADAFQDADRAKWVAWHELTHRGLRAPGSDEFNQTLRTGDQYGPVKALASAIMVDRGLDNAQRPLAVEEAMAELNAAARTGDFDSLSSRYGVNLDARQRSALSSGGGFFARQWENIKLIAGRVLGRDVGDIEMARLLRKTTDAAASTVSARDASIKASQADTRSHAEAFWKLLSHADDTFKYGRPRSFDLPSIAAHIDPALHLSEDTHYFRPEEMKQLGLSHVWTMRMPDGKEAIIQEARDGRVWVDASTLDKGVSAGSKLYAAVASYAAANGKRFVGDPAGLSEAALVRRTEHMLSSALREGSTLHLEPHPRQVSPEAYSKGAEINRYVRPMGWRNGDDAYNLRELLSTSYHNILHLVPDVAKELDHVRFNFDAGRFERDGRPIGDADFRAMAERATAELGRRGFAALVSKGEGARSADQPGSADWSVIGSATLKRAALTASAIRAAREGTWGDVLARLGKQLSGDQVEGLQDLLYSKAPADAGVPVSKDNEKTIGRLASILRLPAKALRNAAIIQIKTAVLPMSEGSDAAKVAATKFADMQRQSRYQWQKFDEILRKNFTDAQLEKMWVAADQENDLRREGRESDTEGLNSLTQQERNVVETLHEYGEALMARARDAGIFQGEGVPYWTPRMAALIDSEGTYTKPSTPSAGSKEARNLTTSASSLKQRKYLTAAETEAAMQKRLNEGDKTAELIRNIRTMPLAMARLESAIAGRELVNQIKAQGQATGEDLVNTTGGKNYFTIEHPALKTGFPETGWVKVTDLKSLSAKNYIVKDDGVYKLTETNPVDGEKLKSYRVTPDPRKGIFPPTIEKLQPLEDKDGNPIWAMKPLYIRKDFEGPLRAVLSTESKIPAYSTFMMLKSKQMGIIMYSPLIHNMVEYGRAIPAMLVGGGAKNAAKNVVSLGAYTYFTGNRAKSNPEIMADAISHGLVPIGGGMRNPDLMEIAGNPLEVGKSWTAKALGAGVEFIAGKPAGDKVRAGVDAAGQFWHETLLWDRIADLQMGLYVTMRTSLVNKGVGDDTASTIAAHFANRYAGALPNEAVGQTAREIMNLAMFSRTFTTGNLGAMKDMIAGLPSNRQAMVKAYAYEASKSMENADKALSEAQRIARHKAIAAFVLDVAAMYAVNSLTQDWIKRMHGDQTWAEQVDGYKDRLGKLGEKIKSDPASVLTHPFNSLESLSSTSVNPEGKTERIRWGEDEKGNSYYIRLPFGKIGEEFTNYTTPSTAIQQLHNKLSPFVKPLADLWQNEDFAKRQIVDPDASGIKQVLQAVGYYAQQQVPWDTFQSLKHEATGHGEEIDRMKLYGPLAGLTFSKVTGGDEAAEMRTVAAKFEAKKNAALPDVKEALQEDDYDKAEKILEDLGMSPREIRSTLQRLENPSRISRSQRRAFNQHATEEQKARAGGD